MESMLRTYRLFLPIAALYSLASAALAAAPHSLRSPWDGKPVTPTGKAYVCPVLPHIPADLTTDGFYRLDDPTHSIVDPVRQAAYNASSGPVKREGMDIVAAADAFRTTGSLQAAECVRSHILALAQGNSIAGKMSSNQAYYVQGWIAGAIAIDYLKVREAAPLNAEQTRLVGDWLHSIGAQTEHYYDGKRDHGDKGNNHLYWAGVELAAIGIAANRRDDLDWGLGTYETGVKQIRPDGTLPLEMARGSKALHYHLYALAPLVMLAEFGEANGMDLYAHANGAIHRLVKVSVGGLADPTLFEKATGVKQEVPRTPSGDQIGWAPPYVRRFPDATISQYIANARTLSIFYLGGLPPE
ncbi:MAG TPA: alginate lyase family protein [Acidobacteriaceae bacterium]|jgi:poly(beta-D-mannuronate) lyase